MKKTILLFCSILALAGLSGCSNTAEGMGKDLKNTGQWFEDTF